MINHKNIH